MDNLTEYSGDLKYADILYPSSIIKIMDSVLNHHSQSLHSQSQTDSERFVTLSELQLSNNPEKHIDQILQKWLSGLDNLDDYLRNLLAAIIERKCVDCFLARINLDCLRPLNRDNVIKITHAPKLPRPSWPGKSVMLSDQEHRLPRNLIPQFKQWLVNNNHWTSDLSAASARLESQLYSRDFEQLILARIGFLALCYASQTITKQFLVATPKLLSLAAK